jgi:superfamily II DNA or RNA helicase
MTVPPIQVGRHAIVPKGHPIRPGLMARLTLANPAYELALRLGKRPVEVKKDPDTGRKVEVDIPPRLFLYEQLGEALLVPRALASDWRRAYPVEDRRTHGEPIQVRFLGTLRAHQEPWVGETCDHLDRSYGTTSKASAGFGKTVCACAIIARRGKKTLILVHKEFLMDQWIERMLGSEVAAAHYGIEVDPARIQAPLLDLKPEDIGIVRQAKCQWRDKKVVIAMAQSLNTREYDPAMYESFGLVIVDEVHRFAAPTFQTAIVQFPAAERLGLTATVKRADGLEDIFLAHIGPVGAVGEAVRVPPRVYQVKSPVVVTPVAQRSMSNYQGRPDYVKTISYLAAHEARNKWLTRHALEAVKNDRQVIVFSHRVEHLETLEELFRLNAADQGLPKTAAFYIGGMKLAERKEAEKADALFATYSMAKEGLDIPTLNTLIMGTPVKEVEQLVGRIQRAEGELQPVVLDPVDKEIQLCRNLAGKRLQEYKTLKWL